LPEAPARDVIETLAGLAVVPGRRTIVLIDGRSGSGKTTLGLALAGVLEAQYVGLDDVYPGWEGLDAASEAVATSILREVDPGYQRWDWAGNEPSTWRALDSRLALVVEGAGSLTPASAPRATLRLWLELDAPTRRSRALARDGAAYEPWWDVWAAQEEEHIRRDDPQSLADRVL
jgi:cytidylate kinase